VLFLENRLQTAHDWVVTLRPRVGASEKRVGALDEEVGALDEAVGALDEEVRSPTSSQTPNAYTDTPK